MAASSKTIDTRTCGLCGVEHPRGERASQARPGLHRGSHLISFGPKVEEPTADVCEACQQRPIVELVALREDKKAETDEARRPPRVAARYAVTR